MMILVPRVYLLGAFSLFLISLVWLIAWLIDWLIDWSINRWNWLQRRKSYIPLLTSLLLLLFLIDLIDWWICQIGCNKMLHCAKKTKSYIWLIDWFDWSIGWSNDCKTKNGKILHSAVGEPSPSSWSPQSLWLSSQQTHPRFPKHLSVKTTFPHF